MNVPGNPMQKWVLCDQDYAPDPEKPGCVWITVTYKRTVPMEFGYCPYITMQWHGKDEKHLNEIIERTIAGWELANAINSQEPQESEEEEISETYNEEDFIDKDFDSADPGDIVNK